MVKCKFLCLALAALLTVLLAVCASAEDAVIHIADADGLYDIALAPGASYVLDADIDLDGRAWQPIRFSGKLDGGGHSISNVSITAFDPQTDITVDGNGKKYDTNLMAFFSVADHAEIRNVQFRNVAVYAESDDHAFAALVAAVSNHCIMENVTITGSACLYCGAKMGGVGGFMGFGTGDIKNSEADVTLIYVDTNKDIKCEQFLGTGVAAGFINCSNVKVQIDGYASVFGYAHCGGLVGMFRLYEDGVKKNTVTRINRCTVAGSITFFERNSDRRAYCKAIIGEKLNRYVKTTNNKESGFKRKEIKKYDKILLPEGWE